MTDYIGTERTLEEQEKCNTHGVCHCRPSLQSQATKASTNWLDKHPALSLGVFVKDKVQDMNKIRVYSAHLT